MRHSHTSGPWKVDGDDQGKHALLGVYIAQDSESGGRIGQTFANCLVKTDEECRANARLIAAAPELLSALELAEELYSRSVLLANGPGCGGWINAARALIARATGEQ